MASIFTRIIRGEIPCYRIAETDTCLAFLDIRPNVEGHTLCIPKLERDYLFDLPEDWYTDLLLFSRRVAKGLGRAFPDRRVGVLVVGTEVPHAHIHLIPFQHEGQMNLSAPKLDMDAAGMAATADLIARSMGA
ncbi:MAG: hypothetical protein RLY31_2807 [Bacteroidota bacterium]|jgi:histidine triad (HIT) family protein